MRRYYKRIRVAVERLPIQRYKRYWLTAAFFLGFLIDNLTLNRVDQVFDNAVLASYVLLAGGSLLLLYAAAADRIKEKWQPFLLQWAPLAVQFAFGGLLSGILIFYGRSGSLLTSWPFILVILAVIIGNETLKKRAQKLVFNLVILFVGLFSYVVLVVPVVIGKMGAVVFVLSGIMALLIMYGFIRLLVLIVPRFMHHNMRMVVFSVGITFASLNFLYFTNIIPPIPLSLKDIGMYHKVERLESGDYQLTYEEGAWWEFWKDSDTTFHYQAGDDIYCFASVFAPTRLSTEIFHRWEYYDEEHKEWVLHDRLSYRIDGGRDGGFRGFTLIRSVRDGAWRCTVETTRKQVLGREKFIIQSGTPEALVTELH